MKHKDNGGFSLLETVVAIAILAAIVIPVCSSLVLSVRLNGKAGDVLEARLAVSSAVETLMAEGISEPMEDEREKFPGVEIDAVRDESEHYYNVAVTDINGLVTVTTCIRAVEAEPGEGQE